MVKLPTIGIKFLLVIYIFLFFPYSVVYAQASGNIIQTFPTQNKNLKNGDIVTLFSQGSFSGADLSIREYDAQLLGVVSTNSLIVFSNTNPQTSIPVASSGNLTVSVSTLNGNIAAGDPITSSVIPGVGEKADKAGIILGNAVDSFDGTKAVSSKDISVSGQKKTVKIGLITVNVQIQNFVPAGSSTSNGVADGLIFIGSKIAGKSVPLIKVIIAAIILLAGLGAFVYGIGVSTRNSIRAIGRNPLAKSTIQKSLFTIIVIFGIVFAASGGIAYLIITTS